METAPRHRCLPLVHGDPSSAWAAGTHSAPPRLAHFSKIMAFQHPNSFIRRVGGKFWGISEHCSGFGPCHGAALLLRAGLFSSPSLGPPGLHKQLCLEKSSALFKNTVVFQCCASPEDVAGRQLRRKSSFQNRQRRRAAGRKLRF